MYSYHIQWFDATDPWPNGGWSLYRITGDEIARRVKWAGNKVVRRDSWPGYIGNYETLLELAAAVADDKERLGVSR